MREKTTPKAFYGYYKDDKLLLESSSGGAGNYLSELILKIGGVVYGCAYSADFLTAEYKCVSKKEDLYTLKGSKYIRSDKIVRDYNNEKINGISVFEHVKNSLSANKAVLFIGLPCDVGALKLYLKNHCIDEAKLYTVDLICHGSTYKLAHEQYIRRLEKKYRSNLKSFSVRYKKEGWLPKYIHAEFENGEIYDEIFNESDYGRAFSLISPDSCYACKFKGDNHPSDITIGAYWGVTEGYEGYNKNGVSLILSRNAKGDALINMIDTDVFTIGEADYDLAMKFNPHYYESRKKDLNSDKFKKTLERKGLHAAVLATQSPFHFVKFKFVAVKRKLGTLYK